MVAREYVGPGGAQFHLDEPLSPQMAEQVARGHLTPADGDTPDVGGGETSLVVVHGSEAQTVDRVGRHVPAAGNRPDESATASEWATYAVRRGLLATQATSLTLTQLVEWVDARDEAEDAIARDDSLQPADDAPADDAPAADDPEAGKPKTGDKVDDWRGYTTAQGLDPAQADEMTKAQLQQWAADHETAGE
ncbi:hypothetical protein [Streptomyces sp. H27-D2]|uniref:hypothetical protein n=1 Tax=Streptomyces sp. H27-D2 TaxID=3046304 RepID=UPI002DB90658|nr:hypothetical protein [Streptomyces sp. H27-D2]MEC4016092.1 hypothetical protein [Streptomyces sp. H27-D2]